MSVVVKKKKKTLLGRIAGEVRQVFSPPENKVVSRDVPPGNSNVCNDDADAIELRRNELRSEKHENTDVVIRAD